MGKHPSPYNSVFFPVPPEALHKKKIVPPFLEGEGSVATLKLGSLCMSVRLKYQNTSDFSAFKYNIYQSNFKYSSVFTHIPGA